MSSNRSISLRRIALGLAVAMTLVAIGVAVVGLQWWFRRPRLVAQDLATLRANLPSESLVTYADGETPLGSLFGDEHRVWVEWQDLPPAWVEAVVAIEDARFWKHDGVDPTGIARAAWRNWRGGQVTQGASTLTMQVVDNLGAGGKDLRGKAIEAREAFALERRLSKEEIIEVYANLFHVRGNGSGIDVAARYYFDQRASDLGTVESAFIAGTLHAPAHYAVFASDPERRAENRARARNRTRLVLERMASVRPEEIEDLLSSLTFREGEFRFDESSALARVRTELSQPPLSYILADEGITDPSRAGLQVVTSLDQRVQYGAEQALREGLDTLRSEVTPAPGNTSLDAGAIVLREGAIVAMVGGYEDRGHDRATVAERQPGSVAKVPLYALALSRGWTPTDVLENGSITIPFHPDPWSPRGGGPETSTLSGGLVYSRNKATAWLLAHLYDPMPPSSVSRIALDRGFARGPAESQREWKDRLLSKGVRPSLDEQRHRKAWLSIEDPEERRLLSGSSGALGAVASWEQAWDDLRRVADERPITQTDLQGWWVRGDSRMVGYGRDLEGWTPMTIAWLRDAVQRPFGFNRPLWAVMGPRRTLLNGEVPVGRVGRLDPRLTELPGGDDPWDLQNLVYDPTFRVALALDELVALMDEAGLDTRPQPIPSVILGSEEITLAEQTAMFASLVEGRVWADQDDRPTTLVSRLVSADGRVLWEADRRPSTLRAGGTDALRAMLAAVTERGTARRIAGAVRDATGAPVPVRGKTGTSDEYKDASFVGVVEDRGVPVAVGVRIGFDTPASMRLAGSTSGVGGGHVSPLVADIAQAVLTPPELPDSSSPEDGGALLDRDRRADASSLD